MSPADSAPSLAAVLHPAGAGVDELLATFAAEIQATGRQVGGVVQQNRRGPDGCDEIMELIDLSSGRRVRISQELGRGSLACRVDAAGIAEAAVLVRNSLESGCDLLIVNKFAALEVQGGGLLGELGEAALRDIPVLTSVNVKRLEAWSEFTGGLAVTLPADLTALHQWWQTVKTK